MSSKFFKRKKDSKKARKTSTNPLGLSQEYIDKRNEMLIKIGRELGRYGF